MPARGTSSVILLMRQTGNVKTIQRCSTHSLLKNLPIALYFVAGDHDDYEIESQIGPVYKVMREHNFDVAMRIVSGVHDFSTWRPELPDALRFVCDKLNRPELAGGEQAQPGK